jgi:pimeloyl-ACP methyl ester carboxylesterase
MRKGPVMWMLVGTALLVGAAGAAVIGWRAYRAETALFFPARAPLSTTKEQAGITGLTDVELGTGVRGWYAPGRTGASIVLVHGAGADRGQMLPEARALAADGFGVLLFDLPGHGESAGEVHWAEGERQALRAALDWMAGRKEVKAIGAMGFSMGGYALAQVAGDDARVRAVVLAGTPADVGAQSAWHFGRYGILSRLPARLALKRGGLGLHELQPRVAVGRLAPRPLLLVSGSRDATVPAFLTAELFAAARDPKEQYVVEGADHGGYAAAAPGRYQARVVEFFRRTLLAQGSGTGLAK